MRCLTTMLFMILLTGVAKKVELSSETLEVATRDLTDFSGRGNVELDKFLMKSHCLPAECRIAPFTGARIETDYLLERKGT